MQNTRAVVAVIGWILCVAAVLAAMWAVTVYGSWLLGTGIGHAINFAVASPVSALVIAAVVGLVTTAGLVLYNKSR